ncbi:MAG: hypothetical protein JW739_05415 [Opitutales bacterium]|nr:hypothetical protein [Opitutales bacterium]
MAALVCLFCLSSLSSTEVPVEMPAPSLQQSLIPNAGQQTLYVYLPQDYESSGMRYSVIYFLTGYGMDNRLDWIEEAVNQAMQVHPCILVSIPVRNELDGAFMASNQVVGDWESFICRDVLAYVDAHYRTLPSRENRFLAGFSMGGYGALRLGLEHADLFSAVYALAPGLFADNGLEEAMPTWDETFLKAYGAAMAPDLSLPYPYAQIPLFDGSSRDKTIQAKWNSGFGGGAQWIEDYLHQSFRHRLIVIEAGAQDWYAWIPKGCCSFSSMLLESGIPHSLRITPNGHDLNAEIFTNGLATALFPLTMMLPDE